MTLCTGPHRPGQSAHNGALKLLTVREEQHDRCFRIPRSLHYLFKLSVNGIDRSEKRQEKKINKTKARENPSKRIDAPCRHLIISLLDRCPSSLFL